MASVQDTHSFSGSADELAFVFSTKAIRDRAEKLFALSQKGGTAFSIHLEKLPEVAQFVAEVTRENYPTLQVPFHSRWAHFQVGGVDRCGKLDETLAHLSREDQTRAKLDLVVVSVLLDAGAGTQWKYLEKDAVLSFGRSEGLALASLDMFLAGLFSSNPAQPYQVDSVGLKKLTLEKLAAGFQVNKETNPLVGLEGRLHLLNKLGEVLDANVEYFSGKQSRISNLIDALIKKFPNRKMQATDILTALQKSLGAIWPGRNSMNGVNLGDVWVHSQLGTGLAALVPFHKLSQWLTYSVLQPLLDSGFQVEGFDDLTGLAEYRNGGLLIDRGLLKARDPKALDQAYPVNSEFIIEWRSLTVALLDRLVPEIRKILGKTQAEMPLGKVLEGGTWSAGRIAAKALRADGRSPVSVISDGTVF